MSARGSRSGLLREVLRLLRPFWRITFFSTMMGTLGGLATAWLLATINLSLHSGEGVTVPLLARFAGLPAASARGIDVAGTASRFEGRAAGHINTSPKLRD